MTVPVEAIPVNESSLSALAERVPTPTYDRRKLSVGIVHFGVGGFHRAHQAFYLDRLMNAGEALDWAVCGVGVTEADREMSRVMREQGGLYTLVIKHSDGVFEPRIIGSIVDYMYAPDDPEAVIERLANEATRVVTLTVTEGGYSTNDLTGEFDPHLPAVARDLEEAAVPATFFGLITEALRRRRERGATPFTIVSCDNIQGNGTLARNAFVTFARLRDADLGDWVDQHVRFPNSMVDRITPVTTDADRADLRKRFGVDDLWPVVCEPFAQWVLEESFVDERPPFEHAGVQVVEHVEPYELMKLRLLNASHQGLCYFAHLCGYVFVHEAAQDPLLSGFLLAYMEREATPTLDPVPGVDLGVYRTTLIERFSNPEVRDTIARLCAESSDRIPKWLLPVVRMQLNNGGEVERSAAIVASWARYAEGIDEHGAVIDIVDRRRDELMAAAALQRTQPLTFIANRELFGDLVENQRFVQAYLAVLRSLHNDGARATLQALAALPD